MRLGKLITTITASALVSTPVLANPAASLSLTNAPAVRTGSGVQPSRTATSLKKSSKAAPIVIGLIFIALVGGGLIAIGSDDGSDSN